MNRSIMCCMLSLCFYSYGANGSFSYNLSIYASKPVSTIQKSTLDIYVKNHLLAFHITYSVGENDYRQALYFDRHNLSQSVAEWINDSCVLYEKDTLVLLTSTPIQSYISSDVKKIDDFYCLRIDTHIGKERIESWINTSLKFSVETRYAYLLKYLPEFVSLCVLNLRCLPAETIYSNEDGSVKYQYKFNSYSTQIPADSVFLFKPTQH